MANGQSASVQQFWKVIADVEKERNSRIFCLIQLGDAHISPPVAWKIFQAREQFRNVKHLEILLHSPGGHADDAYTITKFLRAQCRSLSAIVPLYAKSAATLMCLGASPIYMGEMADLGPLDVQIQDPLKKGAKFFSPLGEFKSMELLRNYAVELLDDLVMVILQRSGMSVKEALHEASPIVSGMVRHLFEGIDPIEMGEHMRSLAIGEEYAKRLLAQAGNPNGEDIASKLVWRYPSHEFVIHRDEAKSLGLPILPIPKNQETKLLGVISDLIESGESICEISKPQRKTKSPSAQKERGGEARATLAATA